MPRLTNFVMKYGDPANYEPPMSIEVARSKGFTDISFYPTLKAAAEASHSRCVENPNLRTKTFDEVVKVGGRSYVLHVLAETPRPKPRVKVIPSWGNQGVFKPLAPKAANNPKLDAFAVFMGEWAAKIRNAVKRPA